MLYFIMLFVVSSIGDFLCFIKLKNLLKKFSITGRESRLTGAVYLLVILFRYLTKSAQKVSDPG